MKYPRIPSIIISIFSLVFLLNGCKKEVVQELSNPPYGSISGQILLPVQSQISTSNLSVINFFGESAVSEGRFTIKKNEPFSPLFVSNDKEEVVMMGYIYPGQNDYDISAKSTLIALIMSTPSGAGLSDEGKLRTIINLKNHPNFSEVIGHIESSVRFGKNLFDQENVVLIKSLSTLFNSVSARISSEEEAPVQIHRANKDLIFINNARSHKTVIGIYKNGERQRINGQEFLVIDEVKFFPSSVSEIVNNIMGSIPEPIEHAYTMEEDGEYKFKIRTGKPSFSFDESDESKLAANENFTTGIMDILSILLGNLISNQIDCKSTFIKWIDSKSSTVIDYYKTNSSTAQLILDITDAVISDLPELLESCFQVENEDTGLKFLKKGALLFKFISYIDSFGNFGNTTLFAFHWESSIASMDRCFNVLGSKVENCEIDESTEYILSGGPLNTDELGADDDFDVYLNGEIIFQNNDGISNGSPPLKFIAKKGDILRVVGHNTIPPCAILTPLYLYKGDNMQVLSEHGFSQNCGVPIGVFFDQEFVIGM